MKRFTAFVGLLVLLTMATAGAQVDDSFGGFDDGSAGVPSNKPADYMSFKLVPSHLQVTPGQTFHVAVDITIEKDWAWYGPAAGEGALPGDVSLSAGNWKAGEPLWPADHAHSYIEGLVNWGYENRAVVYVPVMVPTTAETGQKIQAVIIGQVCGNGTCLPIRSTDPLTTEAVTVQLGDEPMANPAWDEESIYAENLGSAVAAGRLPELREEDDLTVPALLDTDRSTAAWLGLALLAGIILNIMPCVLPIIPLRIMSVVDMAAGSRKRYVTLGLAFAGGILVFFLMLAVINAILNLTLGEAFNWSTQWQNVYFRIGMALVLLAVSANFFGLFNVTVPTQVAAMEAGEKKSHGEHVRSVGMGLMMAVLSTPCSFGVLLAALAWAQTQSLLIGTAVFALIGIGMALPHVILASFPGLIRILPKPGVWMEYFKQSMGFVLLLVVVWLMSTVGGEEPGVKYFGWVVAFGVVLAFCLWMWGTWVKYSDSLKKKLIVRGIAVLIAVAAGWFMLRPPTPLATNFESFDKSRLVSARENGKTVVLKFTASWCGSCKEVDYIVYDSKAIAGRLNDNEDILVMKGDVTDEGTPASNLLKDRYKAAPPLTVVYPPGDGKPIFLPGVFSKQDLLQALDRATSPG
ncbi:MAG: protein-disulfide reductase DsbD family protein [Phycisphaerae bacterium]